MTSWDSAFEALSEEECLSLLAQVHYGRVAVVTADGHPEIFPVNFALEGRSVLFSTASRVLLERAPLGHIAFEADSVDPRTHEGWDVVVNGEGAEITDSIDKGSVTARSHPIEHWAPGHKDHWMTIVRPSFHGRRLYAASPFKNP